MNQVLYKHDEEAHNTKSAEIIVPFVIDWFKPASVLDVGCGIGTWLNVCKKHGVSEILGIDGDYVNRDQLVEHINTEEFIPLDLRIPFDLKKRFDLAISLEVAEHLPETAASGFIKSLCSHSDTILFSAALPNQGGQHHLNEQYPDYWEKEFLKHGFQFYDLVRPLIWNNSNIEFWYKQNIFVASKLDLTHIVSKPDSTMSVIHPELFENKVKHIHILEDSIQDIKKGIHPSRFYLKLLLKSMGLVK